MQELVTNLLRDQYVRLMISLSSEKKYTAQECKGLKMQLGKIDMERFFKLCMEHELEGVVASHIRIYDLISLPDYWQEAYLAEQERLSFFREKTKKICDIMHKNGIDMVALKNGGIMCDMIGDAAACPMEDIDSLVRKRDFFRAHDILIKHGFIFKFRSKFEKEELENAYRDGSTEYYFSAPDGSKMWFELAWRAVAGRWIRPDLEPDTDSLLDRSYFAADTCIKVLSPEDNLLQVCIHTAKHSYVRAPGLRLHLDVERIVSLKSIDWELFVEKVKMVHVKTACYYSLLIPRLLFGTPIPDDIIQELAPSARKMEKISVLLAKAGLLHPKEKKFSKFAFLRLQTALYDSVSDMFRVIYPSYNWYMDRYALGSKWQIPFYVVLRGLDLIGIRKSKK